MWHQFGKADLDLQWLSIFSMYCHVFTENTIFFHFPDKNSQDSWSEVWREYWLNYAMFFNSTQVGMSPLPGGR